MTNDCTAELIPDMHQKCLGAYKELMPPCKGACCQPNILADIWIVLLMTRFIDWTPVLTYQFLLKVFSRVTARSLVGPELCDSQEWQDIILGFTNSAFKASHGVRARYHPWTRWMAKYLDEDVKNVYRLRKRAGNLLRPILDARKAEYKVRTRGSKSEHDDGIQWLLDAYRSTGSTITPDKLAQDEFIITIASIHSSAATALSILYDLMDRPDSLMEIQEEISMVLQQHGGWTRQSLGALRIMDSFMKESQRIHTLQQCKLSKTPCIKSRL